MSTHTTTPARPSTMRRLALLALALLVVLTGVGLGSSPASALVPLKPQAITAAGYDDFIRVYWAPPTDTDTPVTSYRIERFQQGQNAPQKVWNQTTTAPIVDTSVVDEVTYVYRVRASNAEGHGAWSDEMVSFLVEGREEYAEFGTDVAAFVTRQYQDFLGRNPGFGEKQTAVLNIKNGTWTTGDLIDALVAKPERAHRHQIIRLYNAYFDRNADHDGLDYWSAQMTQEGRSISSISNFFSGSSEFKKTYGGLTNAQFVTLVYQNVLDRNPSAADMTFWKGQLDQGKLTRGKLMIHFSESDEYEELSRGKVLAADVYDAMIGETSEGSELSLWSTHIQAGGNAGDYGTRTMLLIKY